MKARRLNIGELLPIGTEVFGSGRKGVVTGHKEPSQPHAVGANYVDWTHRLVQKGIGYTWKPLPRNTPAAINYAFLSTQDKII